MTDLFDGPIDPNVRSKAGPDLLVRGLLTKRADLLGEAETIRDRLAAIKNDVGAIDRTLTVLGYEGDLERVYRALSRLQSCDSSSVFAEPDDGTTLQRRSSGTGVG